MIRKLSEAKTQRSHHTKRDYFKFKEDEDQRDSFQQSLERNFILMPDKSRKGVSLIDQVIESRLKTEPDLAHEYYTPKSVRRKKHKVLGILKVMSGFLSSDKLLSSKRKAHPETPKRSKKKTKKKTLVNLKRVLINKEKQNRAHLPHLWSQRPSQVPFMRTTSTKATQRKQLSTLLRGLKGKPKMEFTSFNEQLHWTGEVMDQLNSLSEEPLRKLRFQMKNNKEKLIKIEKEAEKITLSKHKLNLVRMRQKKRQTLLDRRIRIKDRNNYLIKPGFKTRGVRTMELNMFSTSKLKLNTIRPKKKSTSKKKKKGKDGKKKLEAKSSAVFRKIDPKSFVPTTRERATLNKIDDDTFILFGGFSYNKYDIAAVYNIMTRKWAKLRYPQWFPQIAGHTTDSWEGKLIINGGLILTDNGGQLNRLNGETIIYSSEDGWDKLVIPGGAQKRSHHLSFLIGNDLVLSGGYNEDYSRRNDFVYLSIDSENNTLTSWKSLNIYDIHKFPKLSDHAGALVILKEFEVFCIGRLEYTKECKTPLDRMERKEKQGKCGVYIFGGIDDLNQVKNDFYHISIDGIMLEWNRVEATGKSPPPLFGHSLTFLKENSSLILYGGRNDLSSYRRDSLMDLSIKTKKKKQSQSYGFHQDIYLFDLILSQWKRINYFKQCSPESLNRASHAACAHQNQVIIFGGINDVQIHDANLYSIEVDHAELDFTDILGLNSDTRDSTRELPRFFNHHSASPDRINLFPLS